MTEQVDTGRRHFLTVATIATGAVGAAFVYALAYEETDGGYEFLWDDQQAASLHVRG